MINILDTTWQWIDSLKDAFAGDSGATKNAIVKSAFLGIALLGLFFMSLLAAIFLSVIGFILMLFDDYDNGKIWDGLGQWFNRCMLGNFDKKSDYPPYYLPTPMCMKLSYQDFYLAVNGGLCKLEYGSGGALYLILNLPDFNMKKSKFTGAITIAYESGEAIFEISDGNGKLQVEQTKSTMFFTPTTSWFDKENERYEMDNKRVEISEDEKQWDQFMLTLTKAGHLEVENERIEDIAPVKQAVDTDEEKIGLFLIRKRLGTNANVYTQSKTVRVQVNYWPNGKNDEEGNELTPYLLSYNYK